MVLKAGTLPQLSVPVDGFITENLVMNKFSDLPTPQQSMNLAARSASNKKAGELLTLSDECTESKPLFVLYFPMIIGLNFIISGYNG